MKMIRVLKSAINPGLYKMEEEFWADKNNKAKLIIKEGPTKKDFGPIPEDKIQITFYRNNTIAQRMWVDKEDAKKDNNILETARKAFEIPFPDETEIVYEKEED